MNIGESKGKPFGSMKKKSEKIGDLQDIDNEKFWRLVNNRACSSKNVKHKSTLLEVDQKFVTDAQQIANHWADYYESLATPTESNGLYDDKHWIAIDEKVGQLLKMSEDTVGYIFSVPVTPEEVSAVIRRLPNGKLRVLMV